MNYKKAMAKITKKDKEKNVSISMLTMETALPIKNSRPLELIGSKPKGNSSSSPSEKNHCLDADELLKILTEVKNGNFDVKMSSGKDGLSGKISDVVNEIIAGNKKLIDGFIKAENDIGKEGKLQARIFFSDAQGDWKAGLDSLNLLISELVHPIREMDNVISSVAKGNLSYFTPLETNEHLFKGDLAQIFKNTNQMVKLLDFFATDLKRLTCEISLEGKLGGHSEVQGLEGSWKDLNMAMNQMSGNLSDQIYGLTTLAIALAKGDFSRKVTVDTRGDIFHLKENLSTMVDQLLGLTAEVTRVVHEVVADGKLGGLAFVPGAQGIWKDLTDAINQMTCNLTSELRSIAEVAKAVAHGDLTKTISGDFEGEMLDLKRSFNGMIETLSAIADQVTNVAHEVGFEGRLGGQANVPAASGGWKNLTDNVNQRAENLTTQVRSISMVASAVTKGDLTRNIRVDAKGEVNELKDTLNQMITNLNETALLNHNRDWLKSNIAKFNNLLHGQKDLKTIASRILSELAQVVGAHYGGFYLVATEEVFPKLKLFASYPHKSEEDISKEFLFGEGVVGQCALEKDLIFLSNIPDGSIKISSEFGKTPPANLIVVPVLFKNDVKAVIELVSVEPFSQIHLDFISQLTESIGIALNTIQTNSRTEILLLQSQSLTSELKKQQEELKNAHVLLQNKTFLLVKQKQELETKNKEVEEARRSLEEKAEQLTLTSRYKSEFLANMSHELRTPLNSLLILAQQLYENSEGNLNDKQTRYAKTIHSCGDDLLELINDILDLSKIESGFITANISNVHFSVISTFVEETFNASAETKKLAFKTEISAALPESIDTDSKRLNQILKNLLSNAFKFTERGEVRFEIYCADKKWKGNIPLNDDKQIVAFSVFDSGIGIAQDKQNIIFEAFQQAEGSTSRKYGGTGLGLSICRGLATLLGGTIEVESEVGVGSRFTLYLPIGKTDLKYPKTDYEKPFAEIKALDEIFDAFKMTEDLILSEKNETISEMTNEVGDDRNNILSNDKVVLVVEDDLLFGKVMLEYAHMDGLKVVIASHYLDIFNFITRFSPIAITLDAYLSGKTGWKVLDQIKNDLNYRHIPIHVISREENEVLALKRGAKSFLLKPLQNHQLKNLFGDIIKFNASETRQLLVVGQNDLGTTSVANLFQANAIEITFTSSSQEAMLLLNEKVFDAIIVDCTVTDFSAMDLIKNVKNVKTAKGSFSPVIIYATNDLKKEEVSQLTSLPNNTVVEIVNSRDRLLELTLMLLHFDYKELPSGQRKMIENFRIKSDVLAKKKILVVDDDVRNLFAITTVFERYNIDVITAESGIEAISMMNDFNDVEMVLMDIMMPGMDGYEAIRKIRSEYKNNALPIIAVTAKAMKGDRQKCIEAGASDYITKPLKMDHLLALMRVWFYK